MKLIDYIKGTRRGREANAIEREAMSDAFLSDAIEGYDAVYGSHSDALSELQEKVAKKATKKRKVRKAPLIAENEAVAAAKSAVKAADMPASPETVDTENGAGEGSKPIKPRRKNEYTDDTPSVKDGRNKRRTLILSIAAVFAVAVVGTVVYFSTVAPLDRMGDILAYDTSGSMEAVGQAENMEEAEASTDNIADAADTKENTASQPVGQTYDDEARAVKETAAPDVAARKPVKTEQIADNTQQKVEPAVMERPVSAPSAAPAAAGAAPASAFDDALALDFEEIISDETVQSTDVARALEGAVPGLKITNARENDKDQIVGGSFAETRAALAEPEQQDVVGSISSGRERRADRADKTEVVENPDFVNYFNANSAIKADPESNVAGEVVVEFRVNSKGVPSGITVISSPSPEVGREVISLLVSGPKWEPTGGKRVRTRVEY